MRQLTALLLIFISISGFSQSYKKIHNKSILIDTHNDVMIAILTGLSIENDLTGKTHSDLERFKKGGVDIQIFSIWSDERYEKGKGFDYANRQIDSLYAIVNRNRNRMMLVTTPLELRQAVKQKKLGAMMGLEGGHMIEDSIAYLDKLYQRGIRYMTLTWNNSTSWASSAKDETENTVTNAKKGLNDLGRNIVRRMNELGMLVDLSHVGEQTFWDAIATTTKPVIVSHSCVYALCPHRRNLKDEQIKAIGKNGGVIHLNFYSGFLDNSFEKKKAAFDKEHQRETDSLKALKWQSFEIDFWLARKYSEAAQAFRPPLSLLLDHLDYIVKLIGVNHVGLGSDFDGIESAPQQLDDVTGYPNITKALVERGYSKKEIEKILGGNFIRIFKANQAN
jgi:membrane dipeptidase